MPSPTDKELLEIISDIESDRVEFKESMSGDSPTRIRETICAFANDLPQHEKPGVVFVGVRNNRTIKGLIRHGRVTSAVGRYENRRKYPAAANADSLKACLGR